MFNINELTIGEVKELSNLFKGNTNYEPDSKGLNTHDRDWETLFTPLIVFQLFFCPSYILKLVL